MARLADVAREAGVSMSAASVVLGKRQSTIGVSQETRRRIQEAARRLGYTPSPAAVSLSTGKTHTLGLLVSSPAAYLTHPNGALTLVAMCRSAAEMGYQVLLVGFGSDTEIDGRRMDACLAIGWLDEACTRRLKDLVKRIPVVMTFRRIPGAVLAAPEGSGTAAYDLAAEHLYDLGHRRIAVVEVPGPQPVMGRFQTIARERRLDVELLRFKDHWLGRAYPTIEDICRLDPFPTAIYAFDDDYARALIARLARDGRRVPEDVSVFSGGTHAAGFQSAPALTGIHVHQDQEHAAIVHRVIEALRLGAGRIPDIVLPATRPELIVRESCAPPAFRTRTEET